MEEWQIRENGLITCINTKAFFYKSCLQKYLEVIISLPADPSSNAILLGGKHNLHSDGDGFGARSLVQARYKENEISFVQSLLRIWKLTITSTHPNELS